MCSDSQKEKELFFAYVLPFGELWFHLQTHSSTRKHNPLLWQCPVARVLLSPKINLVESMTGMPRKEPHADDISCNTDPAVGVLPTRRGQAPLGWRSPGRKGQPRIAGLPRVPHGALQWLQTTYTSSLVWARLCIRRRWGGIPDPAELSPWLDFFHWCCASSTAVKVTGCPHRSRKFVTIMCNGRKLRRLTYSLVSTVMEKTSHFLWNDDHFCGNSFI